MADKFREISDSELETILAEHKKWLETNKVEGKRADLSHKNLQDCDLGGAHLEEANLNLANLKGANLKGTNLEGANLNLANLEGANLNWAHLKGANLWGANLKGADLRGADFSEADVAGVKYNRRGRYKGIRVATCHGSARFKRFAQDQDFIEEFRSSWWRYPLYFIWLIFADCGRSFLIWAVWCLFFATCFAFLYTSCPGGLPSWLQDLIPDWLCKLNQLIDAKFEQHPEAYKGEAIGFWSAFYFSVVTFTTLGFGDVAANNSAARVLVTAEVILGYIMLGGLISILATKLTRRS